MTSLTWWAKIDNGQVVDLIIVNGEIDGAEFTSNLDGLWIQSPDNGVWAIMGGFYDAVKQEFYAPQPWESWTLDSNNVWQPPTPKPTDGKDYAWYEAEQRWALVVG
jgi:hypothetical protein